jgi:hypothetical protein
VLCFVLFLALVSRELADSQMQRSSQPKNGVSHGSLGEKPLRRSQNKQGERKIELDRTSTAG